MSYCVNCGVELDKTCSVCPLCHTRVVNPQQPVDTTSPKPFPSRKGTTDPVRRTDVTILATVVLATTAIVCGLLNFFAFRTTHWSLYVIGICCILWIFFIPLFFPNRFHRLISLALDGLSIMLYLGIISFLHPGKGWFLKIALPLTVVTMGMIILYVYFLHRPHHSILFMAVIFTGEVSILTAIIELLIHHYMNQPLTLTWGAITLVCGVVIDAALITILRKSRLREEVRRRMHI